MDKIRRYKNITKKDILILLNGQKIRIKPNETIEGPSILSSYKGLIQINSNKNTSIKAVEAVKLEESFVIEVEEHDFTKDEDLIFESVKNTEKIIEYQVLNESQGVNNMKNRIDLKDVTFTIPISIESKDRENNLTILLDYIYKNFDTNVFICECDRQMKVKNFWKPEWSGFCKLFFIENTSPFFYKTKLLNIMASKATTKIIASYDSDVLLFPQAYVDAAQKIRNEEYDFCYPFNKPLKHINKDVLQTFRKSLDLKSIEKEAYSKHPGVPPGGCFFMNLSKFKEAGMENENMISWGPEDQERLERVKILGYKVGALDYELYHMDHQVTANSFYTNPLYQKNVKEFEKVKSMSKLELRNYVNTWRKNEKSANIF